jgi:hypothetical protein
VSSIAQSTDKHGFIPGTFVQFAADNVDHNLRILDGHNTLHGMGIISMVTPSTKSSKEIPRTNASSADLRALGHINFEAWKGAPCLDLMLDDPTK